MEGDWQDVCSVESDNVPPGPLREADAASEGRGQGRMRLEDYDAASESGSTVDREAEAAAAERAAAAAFFRREHRQAHDAAADEAAVRRGGGGAVAPGDGPAFMPHSLDEGCPAPWGRETREVEDPHFCLLCELPCSEGRGGKALHLLNLVVARDYELPPSVLCRRLQDLACKFVAPRVAEEHLRQVWGVRSIYEHVYHHGCTDFMRYRRNVLDFERIQQRLRELMLLHATDGSGLCRMDHKVLGDFGRYADRILKCSAEAKKLARDALDKATALYDQSGAKDRQRKRVLGDGDADDMAHAQTRVHRNVRRRA